MSTGLLPLAALAVVLLSIVGLGQIAARLRLPSLMRGQAGDGSRLSIRSSLALDPKRRLVIIACDGREGLLLIGPNGEAMLGWLRSTETLPS